VDEVAVHGDSMASRALTTLYRLSDADGNLPKWEYEQPRNSVLPGVHWRRGTGPAHDTVESQHGYT